MTWPFWLPLAPTRSACLPATAWSTPFRSRALHRDAGVGIVDSRRRCQRARRLRSGNFQFFLFHKGLSFTGRADRTGVQRHAGVGDANQWHTNLAYTCCLTQNRVREFPRDAIPFPVPTARSAAEYITGKEAAAVPRMKYVARTLCRYGFHPTDAVA